MISRLDLEARVREWSLREDVVEKDYVLGWVLWGVGSEPTLVDSWAFKGGTCLKKCYLETFRFSEDLDFSILPGGPFREEEVRPVLDRLLSRVHEASGISFEGQAPRFRTHPSGSYTEGRIYYRGPRGAPTVASIRLDLLANETVIRPTVLREISHPYPDPLPPPARVRCYGFEEVFAEKLRALGERGRPRDLYDVVHLFRRPDLWHHAALVADVLAAKCASKGVPVPTLQGIEAPELRDELETEWANMLAHQRCSGPGAWGRPSRRSGSRPRTTLWSSSATSERPASSSRTPYDERRQASCSSSRSRWTAARFEGIGSIGLNPSESR